jgi:hypothetical protein
MLARLRAGLSDIINRLGRWIGRRASSQAPSTWQKFDIINWLGRHYGYKTYLEVATPTTGLQFARIDTTTYPLAERLLYRAPADFEDGLRIDYRCEADDSSELFMRLRRAGKTYDVVFVDAFHTYECARRDLENAVHLLSSRGTLVVHDCNPVRREFVHPTMQPGVWCGLTYAAFLDFVYRREDLEFCVVDTDYGVAVVRRQGAFGPARSGGTPTQEALLKHDVLALARHLDWDFFDAHRRRLLRLVSVAKFIDSCKEQPS